MTRLWSRVQSDTGRESAFTRLRHVLVERDPYSGFGTTACGKPSRQSYGGDGDDYTDEDLRRALERDGIPLDLCPKCDRATAEPEYEVAIARAAEAGATSTELEEHLRERGIERPVRPAYESHTIDEFAGWTEAESRLAHGDR